MWPTICTIVYTEPIICESGIQCVASATTITIMLTKSRLSIAAAVSFVVKLVAGEIVSGVVGAVVGIIGRSENRVKVGT